MSATESNAPARVNGQPYPTLPEDLYIPPDALEVFLETFEGPLDLLLYLIKRQNLNILDIPLAVITRQYMEYLALMQELRLELAAEYLVMAAMLAEIKSRLLLPRPGATEAGEEDPRAELVRRLQEYERFKQAAENLDVLPRLERDVFAASAELVQREIHRIPPAVNLTDLLAALRELMQRTELYSHHRISREPLSVRERMSRILEQMDAVRFTPFTALFAVEEGRLGVVVTFLAILELLREMLLELVQAEPFAPIHVRLRT
jgi:segregation and condensation protein A